MRPWSSYKFILFGLLIALAVGGNLPGTYDPLRPHDSPRRNSDTAEERSLAGDPRLSERTAEHILYGDDQNGGGHHHSANRPCKTEFPESWDADKIITTVKELAANDNAPWRKEDNGYYVSEQPYEGLDIRIVLDQQGDDIVTAYPTNLPRNPCP